MQAKEALKAAADQQPPEVVENPDYADRPLRAPRWLYVYRIAGYDKSEIDGMDCATAMRLAAVHGVHPQAANASKGELEQEVDATKSEIRQIAEGLNNGLAARDAVDALIDAFEMLKEALQGEYVSMNPAKAHGGVDPLGVAIQNFTGVLDGPLNPVPGYIRNELAPKIKSMIEGGSTTATTGGGGGGGRPGRLGSEHDYSVVVQSVASGGTPAYAARWDSDGGVKWFVAQDRQGWSRTEPAAVPESARRPLLSVLRNPTRSDLPYPRPTVTTTAKHRASGQEFQWYNHNGNWSSQGQGSSPAPRLGYGQITDTLAFALLPENERLWLLSRELEDLRDLLLSVKTISPRQRAVPAPSEGGR